MGEQKEKQELKCIVKKRKATRISYRMVGVFFFAIGVFFVIWPQMSYSRNFGKVFLMAFGVALAVYGFVLFKASFRRSAFNLTYIFAEDNIIISRAKKEWRVPYDKVSNVNLVIPDPDMRYYILKIDIGKEQYVIPFAGRREKCDAIYVHLLKKMGIYEE